MKKIIRILMVAVMLLQISATAFATVGLSDIAGHKYQTAIEYLYGKKVIGGYPDGTFKPDIQINRAELLKILVGGAGYTDPDATKYKDCFQDVKTQWYAKYVCFAKEKNWVQGFEGGLFKPEQPARKVEAMKMLLKSEGLPVADKASGNSIYSDVDFSQWFGPYMFMAEAMDIVDIAGAKYGPMDFVTRGEISNNMYRTMLILEQKVGSFDQVVIAPKVDDPVVVVDQFDAPVLTVTSSGPTSILLKWTVPVKTGDSALQKYVLGYKAGNDLDYKTTDYSVEYYDAKLKTDGGIVLISNPSMMYHFKVKAVNMNGQSSELSDVITITTAGPLEPAAPTVEKVSQTFSDITLKVTLPGYTGDSALDSIFSDFTNPNDGMGQGGSTSIENNQIVGSWTVKYNLFPKKENLEQPNYEFSFWVNNKNGKVSEKVVAKFPGLAVTPDKVTVTTKSIGSNNLQFEIKPPVYMGSGPLDLYAYSVDNNAGSGKYGKSFFEQDMNGVLTVGNMLLPDTTYTVTFWVVNTDGRIGEKVTKVVKTSAN